jgi:ABC-2 type transport system permease protein
MQRAIYRYPVVGGRRILPAGGYGFYLHWLGVAGAVSVGLLLLGLVVFRKLEANFAEEL